MDKLVILSMRRLAACATLGSPIFGFTADHGQFICGKDSRRHLWAMEPASLYHGSVRLHSTSNLNMEM